MSNNKFKRMVRSLPSLYRAEVNTIIRGLLLSWGLSDDEITFQIQNTKDQLFVNTAEGSNLDRLGNNVGVDRIAGLGIDNQDFRELIPVLSFYPKQVRATIIALLDAFWGPNFTRPNISAGNIETYDFGPEVSVGGTATFRKGYTTIRGTGTLFLTTINPGDYIKPSSLPGTTYQKVTSVIDDQTLELSLPWAGDIVINTSIVKGTVHTLNYEVDNKKETTIRFIPNAFSDLTSVTIDELIEYLNNLSEHKNNITASKFLDSTAGSKLNLRTNTPGLQGSIQILGGTANAPTKLNFDTSKQNKIKCKVVEVNPNEIIIQIPSSVPVLRRTLRGSIHPRETKAIISSAKEVFDFSILGASSVLSVNIDGNSYVINFNHSLDFKNPTAVTANEVVEVINNQLQFLKANIYPYFGKKRVSLETIEGAASYQITGGNANTVLQFTTDLQEDPDIINLDFPSAYIFDPNGQLYTVTGITAKLIDKIEQGEVRSTITVDDASNFPNSSGKILFNFGRSDQEGPISFTSRPNNNTLLIDASHIFQKNHDVGRYVNLISDTPSIPRLTGEDYPAYITGTSEARDAAQELIKKLIAAGVIIRFIIDFPEFLFECVVKSKRPSIDPEYRGSLTNSNPLDF